MKKSLIALAILGASTASAQAQTNVTIGGIVQANIKSYQVGNTTRSTVTELRVDDDYTSRFWLSGTENLGGGNSALFYIQNRLNTDVSSTIGDGNGLSNGDTYLGLKGTWGQFTIGKHTLMAGQGATTEYGINGVPAIAAGMVGTTSILNYRGATALDNTRRQNSIVYSLPALNGFNGALAYSPNSAGNEGTAAAANYASGQEYYLQGGYAKGPLNLSLAYRNYKVEGRTGTDAKQVRLSGFYKFPMGLKIGANIDQATTQVVTANVGAPESKRVAWVVPVNYTFGANTLLASYTKASNYSTATNTGASMYVLGYDYAFSKRTNVGLFASKLTNDTAGVYQHYKTGTSSNGSVLLAGESATIVTLGIKHIF